MKRLVRKAKGKVRSAKGSARKVKNTFADVSAKRAAKKRSKSRRYYPPSQKKIDSYPYENKIIA